MNRDPLAKIISLLQGGRLAEAARAADDLLRARPTFPPALCLAGLVALRQGNIEAGVKKVALAAELDPRNAGFQCHLGDALSASGHWRDAIAAFERALRLEPRNAAAEAGRGYALQMAGDAAAALEAFQRAAAWQPKIPAIQVNLAAALQRAGRLDEALAALRLAQELAPDHPEPRFGIGAVLQAKGDLAGAEQAYRAALTRASDHPQALNNLGLIVERDGRPAEALALFERALARAPEFAEAHFNRGNALKELGRFGEAIGSYDRALALAPVSRDAMKNRALARLTLGDFAGGWPDHRARDLPRAFGDWPQTPLPGDLSGKTILLRREQGVGDELFYLHFAPLLVARGARVIAELDPRLAEMVGRVPAISRVVTTREAAGPVDIEAMLGDLPFLLGHGGAEDCPPPIIIPPDPARAAAIAGRLEGEGKAPYLAVTWRAGVVVEGRFTKIVAMRDLAQAVATWPGTLVAVQRRPAPGEVASFATAAGRAVADLTDVNDDLDDMLALMAAVDDYVAVSNTNVHLRTAARRPTRVLVPHPPEWRTMADGDSSPWYPLGSRLYRQTAEGDWRPALLKLAADLAAQG